MKASYFLLCGLAGVLFAGTGLLAADGYSANATATLAELQPLAITNCCGNPTNATGVEPLVKTLAKEPLADNATPTNATAASAPIYVPDFSHANDALPDGVLAWNSLSQSASVPANSTQAHFLFSFTNVTSGNVSISTVHPSCGCTTADLPPLPWTIPAGGGGQIPVTVNLSAALAGSEGTLLKAVTVITDKGSKQLLLRINILPPVIATQTDAERTNSMAIAKADRQAIFKADCATCHATPGEGKYGKALYEAVCAVCHDAEHRAAIVPDLHTLTVPTNLEFWRTWAAHGKPGSLMPAFSAVEGGPLNDMQIATLATYLNFAIPSRAVTLMTNAPPSK
jgi:mono/diheme cytochrome c family protein